MIIQRDAISCYKKLLDMSSVKFPASISFKIFKLKSVLKEFYDWEIEEEKLLFNQYKISTNEDGSITFENQEDAKDFVSKMNDIANTEHDFEKIKIPISVFDSVSVSDIEILDKIIDFEE